MKTKVKKLGERILLPKLRGSRKAHKLSQPALAKKAGVTTYVVAVAELGRLVQLVEAQKIAAALGVKLQSLRS
jgi:DNA-binding XRE family transcriptional regulator